MEGLMHFCRNWGDADCDPNVREFSYPKELGEGEEIPLFPVGEEKKRLDEICKKCDSRFLVLEEEICPICESMNVEKTGLSEGISRKDMIHKFKCNDCEEIFGIHEKNLK